MQRRTFLASTAAAWAATLLSSGQSLAAQRPLVMAMALDGVLTGFDPADAYDAIGFEICGNVYQTLVTPDPDSPDRLIGDLAESWDVSEDGLVFTFKIRGDAKFESGNPVTPEDVAFTLHRFIQLNKAAVFLLDQFGFTPENVTDLIVAGGADTVTVTLPQLFATDLVLYCLSNPTMGVIEKVVALEHDVDGDMGNEWLKSRSAGSGAFRLAAWEPNQYITLEANPQAAQKPAVERIIIRHVMDSTTQMLLLRKGDADIARNLGADQIGSIADYPDLGTVVDPLATVCALYMNMSVEAFRKPEVRQAVKMAINYRAIAENIVPNLWDVWQSCVPKGMVGATDDIPFQQDIEAAKALMAQGGYADGFSVTMDHFSSSPFSEIAQAIQADLAQIGITVELLAGENKQVVSKAYARTHEMLLATPGADYLDGYSLAQYFCENRDDSDNSNNQNVAWRNHFADEQMNDLVAAIGKETDGARRLELFATLQQRFFEEAPMAILLQQNSVAGVGKATSGFKVGGMGFSTKFDRIQKAV